MHRLSAGDDVLDPEVAEDAPDSLAGGHGHDAARHRFGLELGRVVSGRLAHPALLLDLVELVEQVGDADLARPPDLDGGLDGGADVVGVDVAVEDAVAPADHDPVADPRPPPPDGRQSPLGRPAPD